MHSNAITADNGVVSTAERREAAMAALDAAAYRGLTSAELRERPEFHHGTASGVLSLLHKDGIVERLQTKRRRYFIYVLPAYVNERPVSPRLARKSAEEWRKECTAAFQSGFEHGWAAGYDEGLADNNALLGRAA